LARRKFFEWRNTARTWCTPAMHTRGRSFLTHANRTPTHTNKRGRCSLGNFRRRSRHRRRRRRLIARKTSVCPSSALSCPPPTSLVAREKSWPDQPQSKRRMCDVAVTRDDLTSSCPSILNRNLRYIPPKRHFRSHLKFFLCGYRPADTTIYR